jgi:predicted AAA+ superfamily ATPase
MTKYLPREITGRLMQARKHLPVLVLSGLRQTGKSTLLQKEAALAQNHVYRTLRAFGCAQAKSG